MRYHTRIPELHLLAPTAVDMPRHYSTANLRLLAAAIMLSCESTSVFADEFQTQSVYGDNSENRDGSNGRKEG
jgi:hypothetical protein